MTTQRGFLFGLLGCTLLLLLSVATINVAWSGPQESEVALSAEELPAAVRAVFDKFAAAGSVGNYFREEEHGQVDYTAEVTICDVTFELELDEDGQVLEVEAYDDEGEGADDDAEGADDDDDSGEDD